MDSSIAAFCDVLAHGCPSLGRSFKHLVDIRMGLKDSDTSGEAPQGIGAPHRYLDFGLLDATTPKRVNKAINAQKRVKVPAAWTPLGDLPETLKKYKGNTLKTHESVARLLPDLAWYDPDFPERGGWVLAGSAARPCMNHTPTHIEKHTIRRSALGIEEAEVEEVEFHMSEEAKDLDLFCVVGGEDDHVREMVGRALVADIMTDCEANPMLSIIASVGTCSRCSGVTASLVHDRCRSCCKLLGLTNPKPYTYAGKHVIGYDVGGFDIQFITRVYKDVDLIIPRFDMTVDGAIFSPKMGLRILPLALQEWRNRMLLLSPFSGSSSMYRRVYKKMQRYGVTPVIPGFQESYKPEGLVFAIRAGKMMGSSPRNYPGMTMRQAVVACKKLPAEYRSCAMSLWNYNISSIHGYIKRVETMASVQRHLVFDEGEVGGEYDFSRVSECSKYVIPGCDIIILTDRQSSSGSSGSFQSLSTVETVSALDMDLVVPTAKVTKPVTVDLSPDQRIDLAVAVNIPRGQMTPVVAKQARRALAAFTGNSDRVILNNLISNREAMSASGLDYILVGLGKYSGSFSVGLVGRWPWTPSDGSSGELGAQIWDVSIGNTNAPPVIRCWTPTGLYQTGMTVCMGSQTHYHTLDAAKDSVTFSLPALIVSLAERPALLMAGDSAHVSSVGVLPQITEGSVTSLHSAAYKCLCAHEWVYKVYC